MNQKITGKTILMGLLFVAAVFILGIKLLNPTSILLTAEGDETFARKIPGVFSLNDVITIIIASVCLSTSAVYLMFYDQENGMGHLVLEERKKRWGELSKTLKTDEQKIYSTLLEAEGVLSQAEVLKKTELPKANVSRALDMMESKGIVEKKRRGMGNMVFLK